MQRIQVPVETFSVKSSDGTMIRAYRCGNGPQLWLLPPGLGTPLLSWKYLFERFHDRMTIVTWDPRGCYGSARPDSLDRFRIEDHVEDGLAVMRAVGWDHKSFITGGWSMGVQIGLEIYNRIPEQVMLS